MILVIGGAYQGKQAYVAAHFGDKELVKNFHLFILDLVKNDVNPLMYVKENINKFQDKVIICDDISSGVVPVDATLRKWREELGRVLVWLASVCEIVIRVFCGLGTRLR